MGLAVVGAMSMFQWSFLLSFIVLVIGPCGVAIVLGFFMRKKEKI
jgi:hypothetical protein